MVQSPPHVSISMEFLDLVLLVMVMGNATGSRLGWISCLYLLSVFFFYQGHLLHPENQNSV